MTCACPICKRYRRIKRVTKKGNVEEMRTLINELWEDLGNAEEDLDIKNAILDGSWPSARNYAERILERTKERAS